MTPEAEALGVDGWTAAESPGCDADDARRVAGFAGFGSLSPPAEVVSLFALGEVVLSPGALGVLGRGAAIDAAAVHEALRRFVSGDWGDATAEERATNSVHLAEGDGRLVGRYVLADGRALAVISEWDRSLTTVATPGEVR